jgi:hypothetical protein
MGFLFGVILGVTLQSLVNLCCGCVCENGGFVEVFVTCDFIMDLCSFGERWTDLE